MRLPSIRAVTLLSHTNHRLIVGPLPPPSLCRPYTVPILLQTDHGVELLFGFGIPFFLESQVKELLAILAIYN